MLMHMRQMLFCLLFLASFSFAADSMSSTLTSVNSLCAGLMQLLPVLSMLMIILAGVIYAAGQMMGAETRARANVWATACVTGALIGVLIVSVAPPVLNGISGQSVSCSTSCTGVTCSAGKSCCSGICVSNTCAAGQHFCASPACGCVPSMVACPVPVSTDSGSSS